MRLADKLTLVRICFAPVFLCAYFISRSFEGISAAVLIGITVALAIAEFTDYLDGYTARKLNQVSETGKILDPFADALLHITIFFCFTYSQIMPPLLFMLIFYREFGMFFLRLQASKKGRNIAARMGGKLKTVLYIATCFWTLAALICRKLALPLPLAFFKTLPLVGTVLFAACAAASYISFFEYIYRWILSSKSKQK